MSKFSEIWDNEVKRLAKDCVTELRLVELMGKGDEYNPTSEEREYLKQIANKYKDICAMYYISDMIWRVEQALADGRQTIAELTVSQVYATLNSESYTKNVFNNDKSSDEYKRLMILRDGLAKMCKC